MLKSGFQKREKGLLRTVALETAVSQYVRHLGFFKNFIFSKTVALWPANLRLGLKPLDGKNEHLRFPLIYGNSDTYAGGALGARAPPTWIKKFRLEMSIGGEEVPPR